MIMGAAILSLGLNDNMTQSSVNLRFFALLLLLLLLLLLVVVVVLLT